VASKRSWILDPKLRNAETQDYLYEVGNTTFIVTPVYSMERGEAMRDVLIKLMRADVSREHTEK
jgi:hypothetical protein